MAISEDGTVAALREVLCNEAENLSKRFRALFSLKFIASKQPPTPQTLPAIAAISEALRSPSALLVHEVAYCLGQTRNDAAIPALTKCLEDKSQDPMCRHEAAEALGALGDQGSLPLLKKLRDDKSEEVVVKETCEIAVERVLWEHDSVRRKQEKLKQR